MDTREDVPAQAGHNSLLELAARIRAEHEAIHGMLHATVDRAMAAGDLLLEAKVLVKHGEWLPWLKERCEISERTAQLYMRCAKHRTTIESRKSATVADFNLRDAALLLTGHGTLEVMGSSASPEWYTPPDIFQLANDVLGSVDLDPCWHPESPVEASTTYTEADDGLSKPWSGRVYLNPPYGRVINSWIEKLVESYRQGRVSEAIVLVPARVDTAWFQRLDAFPRCFISGRLTFSNASSPAPFPSAVIYLGPNIDLFHRVFDSVGEIFVKIDSSPTPADEPEAERDEEPKPVSFEAAVAAMQPKPVSGQQIITAEERMAQYAADEADDFGEAKRELRELAIRMGTSLNLKKDQVQKRDALWAIFNNKVVKRTKRFGNIDRQALTLIGLLKDAYRSLEVDTDDEDRARLREDAARGVSKLRDTINAIEAEINDLLDAA